jgi:hypothetical protein
LNQKYHIEDKVGSTSRGAEENWEYFPKDGYKSLENTVFLKVNQNSNRLSSNIKIFKLGDIDTIVLKETELSIGINIQKPGEYHWVYTAEKGMYDNNFIIPSSEEQQKLKEALANFKKSILKFSPEMQEHLIQEYIYLNKLFN